MPCWFEYRDSEDIFMCGNQRDLLIKSEMQKAKEVIEEKYQLKEIYGISFPEDIYLNDKTIRILPKFPIQEEGKCFWERKSAGVITMKKKI